MTAAYAILVVKLNIDNAKLSRSGDRAKTRQKDIAPGSVVARYQRDQVNKMWYGV